MLSYLDYLEQLEQFDYITNHMNMIQNSLTDNHTSDEASFMQEIQNQHRAMQRRHLLQQAKRAAVAQEEGDTMNVEFASEVKVK